MTHRLHILAISASLLAIAPPATALAGKGGKRFHGDKAGRPGMVLKKYDTNRNGVIDGDEVVALRKAFDADKTGPLKHFDTNSNGALEDSEIAAIKAHRGKGGRKKKNQ